MSKIPVYLSEIEGLCIKHKTNKLQEGASNTVLYIYISSAVDKNKIK